MKSTSLDFLFFRAADRRRSRPSSLLSTFTYLAMRASSDCDSRAAICSAVVPMRSSRLLLALRRHGSPVALRDDLAGVIFLVDAAGVDFVVVVVDVAGPPRRTASPPRRSPWRSRRRSRRTPRSSTPRPSPAAISPARIGGRIAMALRGPAGRVTEPGRWSAARRASCGFRRDPRRRSATELPGDASSRSGGAPGARASRRRCWPSR